MVTAAGSHVRLCAITAHVAGAATAAVSPHCILVLALVVASTGLPHIRQPLPRLLLGTSVAPKPLTRVYVACPCVVYTIYACWLHTHACVVVGNFNRDNDCVLTDSRTRASIYSHPVPTTAVRVVTRAAALGDRAAAVQLRSKQLPSCASCPGGLTSLL